MWAGSGWRTALLTYFTLISPLHSIRRVTIAAGKAFFSISPPQSTTKLSVRGLCSRGREKCYLEIRGCASCRIRAAGRRSNYTVPRCFFFFLYFFFPFFSNSETAPSRCRRNRRISIEEKKKSSLNSSVLSFLFFSFLRFRSNPWKKRFLVSITYLESRSPSTFRQSLNSFSTVTVLFVAFYQPRFE